MKRPDFKTLLRNILANVSRFDLKFWSRNVPKHLTKLRHSTTSNKAGSPLKPVVYLVAILWTIVTVGISVGSFFTLFSSLLLLYFIATRIFGLDLSSMEQNFA